MVVDNPRELVERNSLVHPFLGRQDEFFHLFLAEIQRTGEQLRELYLLDGILREIRPGGLDQQGGGGQVQATSLGFLAIPLGVFKQGLEYLDHD